MNFDKWVDDYIEKSKPENIGAWYYDDVKAAWEKSQKETAKRCLEIIEENANYRKGNEFIVAEIEVEFDL